MYARVALVPFHFISNIFKRWWQDKCRSITLQNVRCKTLRIPLSKYCLRHQDLGTIGYTSIIIRALTTVGGILYQEKNPFVTVTCWPFENRYSDRLECIAHNSGRGEARDVLVSFNRLLPLWTRASGLGVTLQESPTLPNPEANPEFAKTQMAFTVRIDRIAAGDNIPFQAETLPRNTPMRSVR
jgi:hypothetical protein